MEIAITKMSSKGQVVIPTEMRKGLKVGEKLLIIKNKNQFIMEKTTRLNEKLKDDLEFARRTEEAWKEYKQGKFTSSSKEEFLKELKTW